MPLKARNWYAAPIPRWPRAEQAVVCALLGFTAGIVPVLVLQAIVPQAGLKIVLPGWLSALTFIGTLALCLLSALASFQKIATLDPAIVFRG